MIKYFEEMISVYLKAIEILRKTDSFIGKEIAIEALEEKIEETEFIIYIKRRREEI